MHHTENDPGKARRDEKTEFNFLCTIKTVDSLLFDRNLAENIGLGCMPANLDICSNLLRNSNFGERLMRKSDNIKVKYFVGQFFAAFRSRHT